MTRTKASKKQKASVVIISLLILATLAFIWGNSFLSSPESREKSLGVGSFLTPFLELFTGEGKVTDHLVRKLAHFSEFGLLGVELTLFIIFSVRVRLQSVFNILFFSLAAAVADETIQLFTGRGDLVSDILLDFSGAFTGIALALIIYGIVRLAKRK